MIQIYHTYIALFQDYLQQKCDEATVQVERQGRGGADPSQMVSQTGRLLRYLSRQLTILKSFLATSKWYGFYFHDTS
jgi:hypothetical protein